MKNRITRGSIGEFIEYNVKLKQMCDDNFSEKKKKDIVSFWVWHINADLRDKQAMGVFKYDSHKLAYGIDQVKFIMEELSLQEFNDLTNYYWKKGYTLNYSDNVVFESPELIVINWEKPQKQTIRDRVYLFKFKLNRLKRWFNINKKEKGFTRAILSTIGDFLWYNNYRCCNAERLYKKTKVSKERIERKTQKHTKDSK